MYLYPSSSHANQLHSKIEQRLGQKYEESLGLIVNILDVRSITNSFSNSKTLVVMNLMIMDSIF